MSKIWRPFGFACLVAASTLILGTAIQADPGPSVRITSAIGQGVVRLDAKANGPFAYTIHHPTPDLYYIDLAGVAAAKDTAQVLGTDIVRSYRLEQYQAGDKAISRLELLLGKDASPRVVRTGKDELQIVVSKKDISFASKGSAAGAPEVIQTSLDTPVAKADPQSSIRQISVAKNGDSPEVLVLGSGALKPHELRLSKPARLVLDFPGARMAAQKKIESTVPPIQDVRAGQFSPKMARIVIDLEKVSHYQVKQVEGGIAVEFGSAPAPKTAEASSATPLASDASPAAQVPAPSASAAESSSKPAGNEKPDSAEPAQPAAPASEAPKTEAPAPSPAKAEAPSAAPIAAAASSPVTSGNEESSSPAKAALQSTETKPAGPMTVAPVAPSAPLTAAPQASPVPESMPAAATPSPMANPVNVISKDSQSGTQFTGAPISVNLKNVDLQDFFRLIHEISGLNVVVDPNVKGTLTLVLDNVPWDQALDIVLKNNDLDKQLTGNVLRIATKETLRKEADEAKELAKAQIEAADLVTTTRVLSYAKASDMATTIKKFLSPRGDVLADDRTNTLVISDIPTVLPVLDNLIRELDTRSQQVEIEARVVQANRNFARELGSQFAFSGSATGGRNLFGGVGAVGTSPFVRNFPPLPAPPIIVGSGGATTTSGSMPLVTNLGTSVPTSGITYAFSSANFALDYIIDAAESKGVGKLLSKPKEITQNNVQATIKQGTKIPIQTIINNTISVQFVDAVLELQVTPQITSAGTVFLTIHVENTQIDPAIPRIQGIPALDTQSEDSKVLVNDGATVMIGGVFVTNQETNIAEVPFVGSIPIVGQLFRHTTISVTSTELLFFITPRILPN